MELFSRIISSFFFVGYVKKMPGTAGSLAGVMVWILLAFLRIPSELLAVIFFLTLLLGWWCADYFVRTSGVKDPQVIVIDEVLGVWVALAGVEIQNGWLWCIGFLLFRFFDIRKPLGIKSVEKIKGGAGVLADDLLAGIYSNVLLRLIAGWLFR